jgi:SAM-dependent methyltransferase
MLKDARLPRPQGRPALRVLKRFVADYGEELEEVACPLCDSTSATLAFEAREVLYNTPGKYRLVRCDACGLSYVNPRPTPAALGRHYPDDYHCSRPVEDAPRWMQPLARLEVRQQAAGRVRSIERTLGRISADAKILDVGCGRNALLQLIQETRGASGLGIDMKSEAVAYVRDVLKMPVKQGTLLDAELEDAQFDLALMINYLEHEPDPMRVLAETRRVLKPGGHIAIEIPDPEGVPARWFKSHWANLDLPRHLVFFDRKTLKRALAESGFEVVSHHRYALPMYIGFSVYLGLGGSNLMRHWEAVSALSYSLGAPLLPAMPWLPEFSFVIARATS